MEQYEARQERLELLNDEVLSLDPGSMTEEEARQTGIRILSTYVETTRSYARASMGCNLLMLLVFTLLFQDAPVSSDDDYDAYRAATKLLRQFQKGTYKEGYQEENHRTLTLYLCSTTFFLCGPVFFHCRSSRVVVHYS